MTQPKRFTKEFEEGLTCTPESATVGPKPAVPPEKSIFPDYIICLEDGIKLRLLKRHLRSLYGLTPEQYRERWDLLPDYPMIAPNYAEQRRCLTKNAWLRRLANDKG